MTDDSTEHPPDETEEPLVWVLRYELYLTSGWSKRTKYLYGTFDQVMSFVHGFGCHHSVSVMSLKGLDTRYSLDDLTDPG